MVGVQSLALSCELELKDEDGVSGGVFKEGARLGEPQILPLATEDMDSFLVLVDRGERSGDVFGEDAKSKI